MELEITVLPETLSIPFQIDEERWLARTRIVEEREWQDHELVEVSRNYFARCRATNDIFSFGEDVDFYKNGQIIGHDGTWRAGVDEAMPGLVMPNLFVLGARYFQEVAPDVAMDRAEHVESGLTVTTPAGTFEECVRVRETTPLEPGTVGFKIYAADVGLIATDTLQLVRISDLKCPADFDGNGVLNSGDFFEFLTVFFEEIPDADPNADFNADDVINTQDFFDFLTAFFNGCD